MMQSSSNHFLIWAPPLLWLAGITIISVLPSVQLPQFDLVAPDKLGHACAYAGLMALSWNSVRRVQGQLPGVQAGLWIFLGAAGFGILMEIIQGTCLPNRSMEFDDMLANMFGAALAWAVVRLWSSRK